MNRPESEVIQNAMVLAWFILSVISAWPKAGTSKYSNVKSLGIYTVFKRSNSPVRTTVGFLSSPVRTFQIRKGDGGITRV